MAKDRDAAYSVDYAPGERTSFGCYEYFVLKNGYLLARYWHDHRGDDHGLEFIDGTTDSLPTWRVTDFLEGGGPEPLVLSQRAVEYLKQRSASRP